MSDHRSPRVARKKGFVHLATALALALAVVAAVVITAFTVRAAASSGRARSPAVAGTERTLSGDVVRGKVRSAPLVIDAEGRSLLAFPPLPSARRAGAAPLAAVVYLHGVHGRAENGCPWLRDGASEIGWLVCPEANTRLPNDTFSWGGSLHEQRAVVARAERAAHARGADAASASVLVGFSQGSYVAVDLVNAGLGRYRGLVLVAAEVEPNAAKLRAAGVARVALAAGELDASFAPLRRTAERLRREGVDARFVDLGAIGHTYQTPEREAFAEAIAWAGGKGAP